MHLLTYQCLNVIKVIYIESPIDILVFHDIIILMNHFHPFEEALVILTSLFMSYSIIIIIIIEGGGRIAMQCRRIDLTYRWA